MTSKNKMILSAITAIALLGGCGSDTQNKTTMETKSIQKKNDTLFLSVAQAQNVADADTDMEMDIGLENPNIVSVLHLIDGEQLDLDAEWIAWETNSPLKSVIWRDMDGNTLSTTHTLHRPLYYDAHYDPDGKGVTKYIKTVTVTDTTGATFSKSFIVYVHKDLSGSAQALLGPLASAYYRVQPRIGSDVLAEGVTTPGDGVHVETAGRIFLDDESRSKVTDGYYVVTVAWGKDVDRDDDGQWDTTPTPNAGKLHTVVDAETLKSGDYHVSVLTEFFFFHMAAIGDLESMDDAQIKDELDRHARDIIKTDVDGDGEIDYMDVLHWDPAKDMDKIGEGYRANIESLPEKFLAGYDPLADLNNPYDDENSQPGSCEMRPLPEGAWVKEVGAKDVINSFDDACRLVKQVQGRNTQIFEYDANGLLSYRYEDIGSNGQKDVPDHEYFYENGKLVKHIHYANDHREVTRYYYDDEGYLYKSILDEFDNGRAVFETYYDHEGNVIKEIPA